MISKADGDRTPKARDRGETARMSETITGEERGGGESRKRMRESSLPGRTTPRIQLQEPASSRRCRKANPTCNRGRTLSGGLEPSTLAKTTGVAEATRDLCGPPSTEREGQRKRRGLSTLETVTEAPLRSTEEVDKDSGEDGLAEEI